MKIKNFIIKSSYIFLILSALISCSTQEKAPVIMNSESAQIKNERTSEFSLYPQSIGSFKHYKLHEVLFTDTVASLAKRYNVSPHDIIALNKLVKPYYLEPGEVVKIPIYDNVKEEGYLQTSPSGAPGISVIEPNKNTVTILPSLPNENLQDYDY